MKNLVAHKLAVLFVSLAVILAIVIPSCGTSKPALLKIPTPTSLPATEAVDFKVLSAEVPMADGARLAADIYLPERDEDLPAILIMTPYNKASYKARLVRAMQDNHPNRIITQRTRSTSELEMRHRSWLNLLIDTLICYQTIVNVFLTSSVSG